MSVIYLISILATKIVLSYCYYEMQLELYVKVDNYFQRNDHRLVTVILKANVANQVWLCP